MGTQRVDKNPTLQLHIQQEFKFLNTRIDRGREIALNPNQPRIILQKTHHVNPITGVYRNAPFDDQIVLYA